MMGILSSKWFLIILAIVLIAIVLIFTGKKSVRAEVSIESPREDVWNVLTDVSTIKEWNKVLIPIEGEIKTGNTIKYEFYQEEEDSKPAVTSAKVKQFIPLELINQTGGIPGIITFNHSYILTQKENMTTVSIYEKYTGIMVNFWNPTPVKNAYERLLISLKERVIELRKN
ncbi:hypothetical protein COTS27_00580 [Spirochaetota bacterium]|nr:hypothetical protein COTS27_00580 [Spirochaetota bacterium]